MSQAPDSDSAIAELYASITGPRPILVVISGPSGVGKDATLQAMQRRNVPYYFVVTATSRPRRLTESEGVDYHFVSIEEFKEMIDNGELLEHALVYGDYKGIPKKHMRSALASGKDVIMRIDVQGAATIRHLVPNVVTIFLTAESEDELERRLRERKTEDEEKLRIRIATARQELRRYNEFKYIVVNRENALDETVNNILHIIEAEKCKVDWSPVKI